MAPALPAAGIAARRARPARLDHARRRPQGARAADDAFARAPPRDRCSGHSRGSYTSTSTTTSCSSASGAPRSSATLALLARRRRPAALDALTAPRRWLGRRLGGLIAVAGSRGPRGCGSGRPGTGSRSGSSANPFRVTLLRDGKTVVTEDERRTVSATSSPPTTPVRAHQACSPRAATSTRSAQPSPAARPPSPSRPTPTGAGSCSRCIRRPTSGGLRRLRRRRRASTSSAAASSATGSDQDGRPAGPDRLGQGRHQCSYAPIPFFASSAGWGLRIASENESALAFPGSPGRQRLPVGRASPLCRFPPLTERTEVCVQGATPRREALRRLDSPDARRLRARHRPPGRCRRPSELELIKWRDVFNGPAEVLDDVDRLQQAGIPIGWD